MRVVRLYFFTIPTTATAAHRKFRGTKGNSIPETKEYKKKFKRKGLAIAQVDDGRRKSSQSNRVSGWSRRRRR